MRYTDPDQLKAGMDIYQVCYFQSGKCSVKKHKVMKVPVPGASSGDMTFIELAHIEILFNVDWLELDSCNQLWIEHKRNSRLGTDQQSMKDMGIISNNYNHHQVFDSLREARQYACDHFNIPMPAYASSVPLALEEDEELPYFDYDNAMKGTGIY